MANQYDEYDDEDTTTDDGPSNLRKALKKAEKEKKELAAQLDDIQNQLRSQSVKSVLESKGVNAKIAKFIPSDVSTPEQVDAWLTENADIFGFSKSAESAEADDETKANVASYQRINASTQNASTPTRDADLASKLNSNALTKADLDAMTGNISGRFRG